MVKLSTDSGWISRRRKLIKETIKGLPRATTKVLGTLTGAGITASAIKRISRSVITKGIPSTSVLRGAVSRMKELQRKKLPSQIYRQRIRNIIKGIKLR